MPKRKRAIGRLVGLMALMFGAYYLGTSVQPQAAVRAGIRELPPPQHFLSGGERALPVLREISATLKQIDTRLSRIEAVAATAAENK